MPSVTYLPLDADYDPIFADGASLVDAAAVQQIVLTNLKLFLGEWWSDLGAGLPVFQSMLGQLGSARGIGAMQLAIQQNIEASLGVVSVGNVQVSFTNGVLHFTATYQSIFGTATVGV